MVTVSLPFRPPLAIDPLRRFLLAHALPGLDRVDVAAGWLTRAVPDGAGGWVSATVHLRDPAGQPPHGITVEFATNDARVVAGAGDAVSRWLDLGLDPIGPDDAFTADPVLGPLVVARPGLRVPGSLDGFETLVLAVIGQQVSLAAARKLAGRLVAGFGVPHGDGLLRFPTAEALAGATAAQLQRVVGTTVARAATLHGVAVAVAGGLSLSADADPGALRRDLLALPGIGAWTADIVAMRVLRDTDAFLPTDLVLRRALGVRTGREALLLAQPWRPWRAYALMHLWVREVFA